MSESRTKKSIRNVLFTLISYFLILLFQLISRTIFVKLLSVEYLGVNGLFSNILSVLSLAELGIGTSISYSLYKPLADNNISEIKSLMRLFKKLYHLIGIVVIVLGSVLVPFLEFFISEKPENFSFEQLKLYYIIFVLNSGASYFGSYKRTILVCDQKQYLTSVISSVNKLMLIILQSAVLIITHNYILYLVTMIFITITENIVLTVTADRYYPFLKEKEISPISKDSLTTIKKNVYAMTFHRIGDVVVNASDNLIITKFASLTLTGLYSNYTIIVYAARTVLNQIFSALTASIGDLTSRNDVKHDKVVFKNILYINYLLFSIVSLCIVSSINTFIECWLGKEFLLDKHTVVIIGYFLYITGIQKTVRVFRDATGIFYYDRYKPIIEAIVNIVLSIPLTIKYQIFGTLLGTVASTILVSFWVEGYVFFKYHFHESPFGYFGNQLKYLFTFSLGIIGCSLMDSYISFPSNLIIELFIRLVITFVIFGVTIILFYIKTEQMKYFLDLIKRIIKKKV